MTDCKLSGCSGTLNKMIISFLLVSLHSQVTLAQNPSVSIKPDRIATSQMSGFTNGSVDWGDYDNDGDLDLLAAGTGQLIIYRNDNAIFQNSGSELSPRGNGEAAWGDYNNDGRLDILHGGPVPIVYRNEGLGVFSDIGASFLNFADGSADWGDVDNDGDLDILLTGNERARIYLNTSRSDSLCFKEAATRLIGIDNSAADFGDYDADGDLDMLICGLNETSSYTKGRTYLYRNEDGRHFSPVFFWLLGSKGAVAWADHDNNGLLDFAVSGAQKHYAERASELYTNQGDGFAKLGHASLLPNMDRSTITWGDYDSDGDEDLFLAGELKSTLEANIIKNNQGIFIRDHSASLREFEDPAAAWGDYDNDGDLDLILTGSNQVALFEIVTTRWRANTPPDAPGNLSSEILPDNRILLSWDAPADDRTPGSGLSYSLRIGITPGGMEIRSPYANPDGQRLVSRRGHIMGTSYILKAKPGRVYYWSVQAIDAGLAGSEFSSERFVITGNDRRQAPQSPLQEMTGVATDSKENPLPDNFNLEQNYPNPFNPATLIRYSLPLESPVRIYVYNNLGKRIATLVDAVQPAGEHMVQWDGRFESGEQAYSGVYFYQMVAGEYQDTRRMLLIR